MLTSTRTMYTRMREELFRDEHTKALLFWVLQLILNELLRFDYRRRLMLTHAIVRTVRHIEDEAESARRIAEMVWHDAGTLDERLSRRAGQFTELVQRYARHGESILDFGCGDGEIGKRMSTLGHRVCLYDVADYLGTARLALGTNELSFTTDWTDVQSRAPHNLGLALTVLHHCDDPDAELARLASAVDRVLVIESVLDEHKMPWALQAFVDWLYNRGFHPGAEIPVPGNFRTVQEWYELAARLGLRVTADEDLGIDLALVPELHHFFMLTH